MFLMLRAPLASLPDGLIEILDSICYVVLSSLFFIYLLLGIGLSILIWLGKLLCSNVYFIPFNVSLNMLNKRLKNIYRSVTSVLICSAYILFCYTLNLYDVGASVHLYFNYMFLDVLCFEIWLLTIFINNLIFKFGILIVKSVLVCLFRTLNSRCLNYEIAALWIFSLILLLSCDVHPNPGPNGNQEFSTGFLSFCNWNLNTLSKDNFCRVSLLEAHNATFNYDIISLCETSLNGDIQVPENILPGYLYHPLNHPDEKRSGGVGIFYKDTLPLRVRSDLSFDECLVCELKFGRKKIFFTVFYRNPEHKD